MPRTGSYSRTDSAVGSAGSVSKGNCMKAALPCDSAPLPEAGLHHLSCDFADPHQSPSLSPLVSFCLSSALLPCNAGDSKGQAVISVM